MRDIKSSPECLRRINKFKAFINKKNATVQDSLLMLDVAKQRVKTAEQRATIAENALSSAIKSFDENNSGGRQEDFSRILKPHN